MTGQSFRLAVPTLGLVVVNGQDVAATIPRGAIVTVLTHAVNADRFIEVLWEGRNTLMFAQDLRKRGELLPSAVSA